MDLVADCADLSTLLGAARFRFWSAALAAGSWLEARLPFSLLVLAIAAKGKDDEVGGGGAKWSANNAHDEAGCGKGS